MATDKSRFYQKTKEIGGVTYTAQFNGLSAALEAADESHIDGSMATSTKKLTEYVLKNVIVEPAGLTPDDFDSMEELTEVLQFGSEVMQGRFRDAKNESTNAKKT